MKYDDDVRIYINGSNPNLTADGTYLDCQWWAHSKWNIAFILDPDTINTAADWFGAKVLSSCDISHITEVVSYGGALLYIGPYSDVSFSNLIWDHPFPLIYCSGSFFCEKCRVQHIHSDHGTFHFRGGAVFRDSSFVNITNSEYAIKMEPDSYSQHTALTLSRCNISEISSSKFIVIVINQYSLRNAVNISESTFSANDSSTVFVAITASNGYRPDIGNTVNIERSTFQGAFQMMNIEEYTVSIVTFQSVTVRYSQNIDYRILWDSECSEWSPDSVITVNSQYANLWMENVNVTADLHCSTDKVGGAWPVYVPYCNAPTPFLINNGEAHLGHIRMNGIYDVSRWRTSNNSKYAEYANTGIYFWGNAFIYDSNDKSKYFTAFLNQKEGTLNVDDLHIGFGAHFSMIYNLGTVNINGLRTEFAVNETAYYDQWNLRFMTGIINYYGNLNITNSAILGADKSLIDLYGGSMYFSDSSLAQSMMGITTYYKTNALSLDQVTAYQMGKYHVSLGAAIYFYTGSLRDSFDSFYSEYIFKASSLYIASGTLAIQNCNFSFLDSFGMINVVQSGLFEIDSAGSDSNTLHVLSNSVRVDDDELEFHDFQLLESLLSNVSNTNITYYVKLFISHVERQSANATGLVTIGSGYHFVAGNNEFEISIDLDNVVVVPCLYIDSGDSSGCLSGNTFINVGLRVNSGDIASCKHPDIASNHHGGCWNALSLGPLHSLYGASTFTNSSIEIGEGVNVILDDAVFSSLFNIHGPFGSGTAGIQMYDVKLDDDADILIDPFWNISCHQIMNANESMIRQLALNYSDSANTSSSISIRNDTHFESVDFGFAERVSMDDDKTLSVYPGGLLNISYSFVDSWDNLVDGNTPNISMTLVNEEVGVGSVLHIDGECDICVTGLFIQGIGISDVGKSYAINVTVHDDELLSNNIRFTVSECPSGYGVSGEVHQCAECGRGTYSISPGITTCTQCHDEDLEGIECLGGDSISISYNYWMDISDDGSIMSSECSPHYCCQNMVSCDYNDDRDALCAPNRDPQVPLCGNCIDGYSEMLGTVGCGDCDRNNWEYLLFPMTFAILMSVYLLCFDHSQITNDSTGSDLSHVTARAIMMDDAQAIKVMLFTVLLYFNQILVCILDHGNIRGFTYFILPILHATSVSFDIGGGGGNGQIFTICFIVGLTAKQEILLNLIFPALLLSITAAMLCTKPFHVKWMKLCCCCCPTKQKGRVTYNSAILKALKMTTGSILAVIFKILSCRDISGSNLTVHYYYGDTECHDGLWFVAMISLTVVCAFWIAFDVALWRQSDDERQSKDGNALYSLVRNYKPRYWWWETVLLIRRLLASLFIIMSDRNNYLHAVLNTILCIHFGAQIHYEPFKYARVNRLETVCILTLIFVTGFVNGTELTASDDDDVSHSVICIFLLFLMVTPLLMVFAEFIRIYHHRKIENLSRKQIQRTLSRMHGETERPDIAMSRMVSTKNEASLNEKKSLLSVTAQDILTESESEDMASQSVVGGSEHEENHVYHLMDDADECKEN